MSLMLKNMVLSVMAYKMMARPFRRQSVVKNNIFPIRRMLNLDEVTEVERGSIEFQAILSRGEKFIVLPPEVEGLRA
jgi:hypothetical protein